MRTTVSVLQETPIGKAPCQRSCYEKEAAARPGKTFGGTGPEKIGTLPHLCKKAQSFLVKMGRGEKSSQVQISCADFIDVFSFQEEKKKIVYKLCRCLSTLIVGPAVSTAARRVAGLYPGPQSSQALDSPQLRQAAEALGAPEPPQGSGESSPGGRSELPSGVPSGIHFCSLQWR